MSVVGDILATIVTRLGDATPTEIVNPSRENTDDGPDAIPPAPKDRQFVVTIGDLTRVPELDLPGNPIRECWEVDYRLKLRIMASETDETSTSVLAINFLQDARKAITGWSAFLPQWFTFNNAAIDADWGPTITRLQNDGTSQSDGYVTSLLVRVRVSPGEL